VGHGAGVGYALVELGGGGRAGARYCVSSRMALFLFTILPGFKARASRNDAAVGQGKRIGEITMQDDHAAVCGRNVRCCFELDRVAVVIVCYPAYSWMFQLRHYSVVIGPFLKKPKQSSNSIQSPT
jgi:hypothetical protein